MGLLESVDTGTGFTETRWRPAMYRQFVNFASVCPTRSVAVRCTFVLDASDWEASSHAIHFSDTGSQHSRPGVCPMTKVNNPRSL